MKYSQYLLTIGLGIALTAGCTGGRSNDDDADGFHFCVVGVTAPAFEFKMYKWDGTPEDQWPE